MDNGERGEGRLSGRRLAAVGANGGLDRRRPSVMEEKGPFGDAPERHRAELAARRLERRETVGETGTHVVEEEVRVELRLLPLRRQRRRVAAGAADLGKEARARRGEAGRRRRRRVQPVHVGADGAER